MSQFNQVVRIFLLSCVMSLCMVTQGFAQISGGEQLTASEDDYLAYFFPDAPEFETGIPAPHEILGYPSGDMHITPEMLHSYVTVLANVSSKAKLEITGHSYEKRPLTNIYISSSANIKNLEGIRKQHLEASSPDEDILVLKLAYSIHGDEPSGSNAAPLVAYYLTASTDPWVEAFLEHTVVILEPAQNPDGLARFAQWVNAHRTKVETLDTAQRTLHQPWPGGRTNHYWADLNRDWIFVVHPESKARIRQYQNWKPHVLGDYHEQGGNKPSYFFQPGHPKRTHPLTLPENQQVTKQLAQFHADALDKTGQAYFSEEIYDDFYYGKGSAYPDITGGIGLLFEQTASRGQIRDFEGEILTFNRSIMNQITTSFSLMRGSHALREELINYRFIFKAQERQRAGKSKIKGYVFSDDGDPARARAMIEMMAAHNITVHELSKTMTRDGRQYEPHHAWIVPADATQYGLVTSLFESRIAFEDNVFYDVSTWNLPTAFNLPYASLKTVTEVLGNRVDSQPVPEPMHIDKNAVAYAIPWNQLDASIVLEALLAEKIIPRVSAKPFVAEIVGGKRQRFAQGTLLVRLRDDNTAKALERALANAPSVIAVALSSGLTSEGPDLGSRKMKAIHPVKLALLVGSGVTSTEAGAIWHFFDRRVGAPLTLLDINRLRKTDISEYTHILMADGKYSDLSEDTDLLKNWIDAGGVLVAQKRAAKWVNEKFLDAHEEDASAGVEDGEGDEEEAEPEYRAYLDYERDNGDRLVRGSVLNSVADLTHPFAYGYQRDTIPLFRTWNEKMNRAKISYDTPLRYTDDPLLSGFISQDKLDELAGTPAIATHRLGKGYIVTMADSLVFRELWRGTERIYENIIYFTQTIEERKDK